MRQRNRDQQMAETDYAAMSLAGVQRALRISGWHDNLKEFVRIVSVSGIQRNRADEAWHGGKSDFVKGIPCNCYACRRVS